MFGGRAPTGRSAALSPAALSMPCRSSGPSCRVVLAGAGYLGYRMIAGGGRQKAIGGRSRRALPAGRGRKSGGDDFDRKMRELEAIEKRLDAEIGKR